MKSNKAGMGVKFLDSRLFIFFQATEFSNLYCNAINTVVQLTEKKYISQSLPIMIMGFVNISLTK